MARPPLTPERVQAIRDMLATGASYRRVCIVHHVDQFKVSQIAEGSYNPETGWCEQCRAFVTLPCLACNARSYRLAHGITNEPDEDDPWESTEVKLDLLPDHLAALKAFWEAKGLPSPASEGANS